MEQANVVHKAVEIRQRIDAIQDDLDLVRHWIISGRLDFPINRDGIPRPETEDDNVYRAIIARSAANNAWQDLLVVYKFLKRFIPEEEEA